MLARSDPERARHLLALAQADIDERWHYYEQLAGEERSLPQDEGGPPIPELEPEQSEDLP
jgi:pyruvate-ferredoxin/flavodoxin oxidoreductase